MPLRINEVGCVHFTVEKTASEGYKLLEVPQLGSWDANSADQALAPNHLSTQPPLSPWAWLDNQLWRPPLESQSIIHGSDSTCHNRRLGVVWTAPPSGRSECPVHSQVGSLLGNQAGSNRHGSAKLLPRAKKTLPIQARPRNTRLNKHTGRPLNQ